MEIKGRSNECGRKERHFAGQGTLGIGRRAEER